MYYRGTETRELRLEGSFIRSNNHSVLAKKKHVSFSRGVQESREIDRLHLSSPLNAAAPLLSVKMGYLRSTPLFTLCFLKHGRGRGTGRLSSNNRSPKSALPAGKKCCVSFSMPQYRFAASAVAPDDMLSLMAMAFPPPLSPSVLSPVLWRHRGASARSRSSLFLRHFPEPPLPPFPLGRTRTDELHAASALAFML